MANFLTQVTLLVAVIATSGCFSENDSPTGDANGVTVQSLFVYENKVSKNCPSFDFKQLACADTLEKLVEGDPKDFDIFVANDNTSAIMALLQSKPYNFNTEPVCQNEKLVFHNINEKEVNKAVISLTSGDQILKMETYFALDSFSDSEIKKDAVYCITYE